MKRKRFILLTFPVLLYIVTRLPLLVPMNEYMDYDEGTYLMIARFINHGILPYRDIYAVHPPLYYYLLALWMRIFGDTYIVGRALSFFLGLLALFVAYLVGRELRDWKLGVAFSTLLALDPLMVHMNTVVYHETSIELFALLSMYYFVRYFKTGEFKHAYISVFAAAVGSTSKFTILPYLLALYMTILFSRRDELWDYLTDAANVVFNRKQGTVVLMAYLAMTLVSISAVMFYPTNLTRLLIIVPGISSITIVGQKFAVALMLILWGTLTVYVFNASYVRKIAHAISMILGEWRTAVKLGLVAVAGKAVIEIPLGLFVGFDYFNQTYIAQGGRYLPIITLFELLNNFLTALKDREPEFLYSYTPLLFLLLAYFFVSSRGKVRLNAYLRNLALMNIAIYFFVAPVLPNMRFLYPLVLVGYLLLLDAIWGGVLEVKKAVSLVVVGIVFLGMINYGVAVNYPAGKLRLGWAVHSRELRDDLEDYIKREGLDGETYYSVNPMNAYYLGLKTPPYMLDNFGVFYLARENSTGLLHYLSKHNVSYIVFSTWMYTIKDRDTTLKRNYDSLIRTARMNFTLAFAESYENGNVLELYWMSNDSRNLSVTSSHGEVALLVDSTEVAYIHAFNNTTEFNTKTMLSWEGSSYTVRQWSENGSATYQLKQVPDEILIVIPNDMSITLEFNDGIVVQTLENGEAVILHPKFSLYISGIEEIKRVNDKKARLFGKEIILKLTH
ncbi:glycosyltransferase family 39 protein [Palaeococcus ferrophilus]|uniref:glycosyltransferase family 39 protein n=1 Tax=Palaeococcus ferrophilus TaxID=83868 RepID=UPI00064EB340|nr:glycosyltransferase family 39 protein [Palaeococcus ferrophilus]